MTTMAHWPISCIFFSLCFFTLMIMPDRTAQTRSVSLPEFLIFSYFSACLISLRFLSFLHVAFSLFFFEGGLPSSCLPFLEQGDWFSFPRLSLFS